LISNIIKTGFKDILANRLRSLLSMLGIVFGTAALVATMSIAEGAKRQIVAAVEQIGTNLISIENDFKQERQRKTSHGLMLSDAAGILAHSTLLKAAAPIQSGVGGVQYAGKYHPLIITGTTSELADITNLKLQPGGRFLTEKDIEEGSKVCVIGSRVRENLDADEPLTGKLIEINQSSFLVVGELKKTSARIGHAIQNSSVYMPVTVSRELLSAGDQIDYIYAQGVNPELVDRTKAELARLLSHFHDGKLDFSLTAQEDLIRRRRQVAEAFRWALGSIAIVSLVIAGIGIMNILLASVNERIREIGIRKAIGASPTHILCQFLFESLLLTVSGGLCGIIVGIFMSRRVTDVLAQFIPQREFEWVAAVAPQWVLAAFGFAVMTGLIFGTYPALKASRLDAAEALMYE